VGRNVNEKEGYDCIGCEEPFLRGRETMGATVAECREKGKILFETDVYSERRHEGRQQQ